MTGAEGAGWLPTFGINAVGSACRDPCFEFADRIQGGSGKEGSLLAGSARTADADIRLWH